MKTVFITGANRGIGLEFSRQLKEKGFQVIAACRKASDELKELDIEIIEGLDVGSDVDTLIKESLGDRKIDLLINNAGIFLNETLSDMNFQAIEDQFQINTMGPLKVTMAILPNLNSDAKIAIVSSRMGSIADNTSGSYYGYRMSKAAVNAIGKSLAMDLKGQGISVALLHPGYVQTKMTGFMGEITPDVAAKGLIEAIDKVNLDNTGSFWHSNGEMLQW